MLTDLIRLNSFKPGDLLTCSFDRNNHTSLRFLVFVLEVNKNSSVASSLVWLLLIQHRDCTWSIIHASDSWLYTFGASSVK